MKRFTLIVLSIPLLLGVGFEGQRLGGWWLNYSQLPEFSEWTLPEEKKALTKEQEEFYAHLLTLSDEELVSGTGLTKAEKELAEVVNERIQLLKDTKSAIDNIRKSESFWKEELFPKGKNKDQHPYLEWKLGYEVVIKQEDRLENLLRGYQAPRDLAFHDELEEYRADPLHDPSFYARKKCQAYKKDLEFSLSREADEDFEKIIETSLKVTPSDKKSLSELIAKEEKRLNSEVYRELQKFPSTKEWKNQLESIQSSSEAKDLLQWMKQKQTVYRLQRELLDILEKKTPLSRLKDFSDLWKELSKLEDTNLLSKWKSTVKKLVQRDCQAHLPEVSYDDTVMIANSEKEVKAETIIVYFLDKNKDPIKLSLAPKYQFDNKEIDYFFHKGGFGGLGKKGIKPTAKNRGAYEFNEWIAKNTGWSPKRIQSLVDKFGTDSFREEHKETWERVQSLRDFAEQNKELFSAGE